MVLPATAIRYASGQSTTSDNNDSSSNGSTSSDNNAGDSGSSSGGEGSLTDNSGSSSTVSQLITVAHHLLSQLITVAHQLLLLITVAHQLVVDLLPLLQIIMPALDHLAVDLRQVTIPKIHKVWMSTSSWTCTTKRVLRLEFHRLHGATPWRPAHRLGPNIWQRSMKWSTQQDSPTARTLLDGPMGVVWHHSCPHSTIIMGYVLGIH